jgi:hypothetical protein
VGRLNRSDIFLLIEGAVHMPTVAPKILVLITFSALFFTPARAAETSLPATAPASPGTDEARSTLRAFFAENDAAKRKPLAEKFATLAPKSWDEVRRLLHVAAAFSDLPPGRQSFKTEGDKVLPPISYTVRIPAAYRAASAEGWPVIIGCHSTGGDGPGFISFIEGILGDEVEKYVVACPDAPEGGVYHAGRAMTDYPLAVLDDLRHRVNIDSGRVVLTGYSKGGYTTWGTVLFSPGDWAGAVPMASFALTEAGLPGLTLYLPNILNLAVQAHWGENDIEPGQKEGINTFNRQVAAEMKKLGAKKFEGLEYAGQGHGLKLQNDRIREFIAAARREPFPEQGRLLFYAAWQGRAWCARAVACARDDYDFKQRRTVNVSRLEDLPAATRAMLLKEAFEIQVRLRPTDNTLAVTTRGVKDVEIELPAEKLDFTRPLTVTLNGRTVLAGKRAVDWVELLETARRTHDFERLIAGRLTATAAK